MAVLDHLHVGCTNIYTTAFDLMKTTRIGHFDAGFVDSITTGQKAVPLGGDGGVYMEIEGIVDPFASANPARRPWWHKRAVAARGSIFSGVSLRVNTMEELRDIAKRHGGDVRLNTRTPPDGAQFKFWSAPHSAAMADPSESGKPTWCCWENRLYMHPGGQPIVNAPGLVQPMGVAWLEMGGTRAQMQEWLGQNPDDLKMKFNGKSPGLYAVGVNTDGGLVEIRRPSATGA
jgi:hypothetical protein